MNRKKQIENKIVEMYQMYQNGELNEKNIYEFICDIEENPTTVISYDEMFEFYDEYYEADWFFGERSFLVFDGDKFDDDLAIKVYIGLKTEKYKETVDKIIEFAVKNSEDIIQFKARRMPSSDCVVFRINSLKMLDKINEFIENSDFINEEMLVYNPFIPKKDNLMITPDFEGSSYNTFISDNIIKYFQECKNNNIEPTSENFLDYVNNNRKEENDIEHFNDILIDSLNEVSDTEILTKYLFVEVVVLNKINTIFDDYNQYTNIEKFISDKQNYYSEIKKELGVTNSKVCDERFKTILESYTSKVKNIIKEQSFNYVAKTISELNENYPKEETLEKQAIYNLKPNAKNIK